MASEGVEVRVVLDPGFSLVIGEREPTFQQIEGRVYIAQSAVAARDIILSHRIVRVDGQCSG